MADNEGNQTPAAVKFVTFCGSDHLAHLQKDELQRYKEKLSLLGICDPYCAPPNLFIALNGCSKLPQLEFGDLFIYLVEGPSPYTAQQMKAYKSTDSHVYFTNGWVNNPVVWQLEKKKLTILKARVSWLLLYSFLL